MNDQTKKKITSIRLRLTDIEHAAIEMHRATEMVLEEIADLPEGAFPANVANILGAALPDLALNERMMLALTDETDEFYEEREG